MDYGKLAYIKVNDLSRQISQTKTESIGLDCFECKNEGLNAQISGENKIFVSKIDAMESKNVCVLAKIKLESEQSTNFTVKLLFNDFEFSSQNYSISGEQEIEIRGIASSVLTDNGDLSFLVLTDDEITLKGFDVIVFGASSLALNEEADMAVCFNDSRLCISYILNGKLYYAVGDKNTFDLQKTTFKELKVAKFHDCAIMPTTNTLIFGIISDNGDLNLCQINMYGQNREYFVANSVDFVAVTYFKEDESYKLLVAYLKNGKPYYKVFENNVLSQENAINIDGTFVKVKAFGGEFEQVFLNLTDSNFNNYVIKSYNENESLKAIEQLFAKPSIEFKCVYKYLKPETPIENLNCSLGITFESILNSGGNEND